MELQIGCKVRTADGFVGEVVTYADGEAPYGWEVEHAPEVTPRWRWYSASELEVLPCDSR